MTDFYDELRDENAMLSALNDALLHLSRERRWKTDTRSIGERMKCRSCGHRGAIIEATMEAASVEPVGRYRQIGAARSTVFE